MLPLLYPHAGRFDLRLTGTVKTGALMVLPSSKRSKRQKFLYGDGAGSLGCYVMSDTDNQMTELWKLPLAGNKPATSLALGGLRDPKDQVYVSSEKTITGVKKTGKEFFRFPTLLLTAITQLRVHNMSLFAVTECTYTRFTETKESEVFTASDRITVLQPLVGRYVRPAANPAAQATVFPQVRLYPSVLSTPESLAPTVLLATADRYVYMVREGRALAQARLPAAAACVCEVPAPAGVVPGPRDGAGKEDTDASQTTRYIVFGKLFFFDNSRFVIIF